MADPGFGPEGVGDTELGHLERPRGEVCGVPENGSLRAEPSEAEQFWRATFLPIFAYFKFHAVAVSRSPDWLEGWQPSPPGSAIDELLKLTIHAETLHENLRWGAGWGRA